MKTSKFTLILSLVVWSLLVTFGPGTQESLVAAPTEKATSAEATAPVKPQGRYENLELFQKVLHFVESNYVEEVKNKDLLYGAIKGMLETLDPHSNFLPPEIFKEVKTDTSGKFGGLGIEIGMKGDVLTVIAPIEDTPAWRAGLKPADRITKINGESTKGLTIVEAVSKMRGKKGSSVKLTVYRPASGQFKDFSLSREIIKIQSVKSEQLEPQFGYVRLSSFNESAASDLRAAIEKLNKKEKLRGLVFDLRSNPGGLLEQAVDVASLFIDEGVIVSTIGRNKDQKEVKYARKGTTYKEFPVAVLINSSSASAAEIVAGALQDHHRAIVMGQPSFGKGSVQTVVELGGDMGLKLTIARYYTPSGRSIQEKGVKPDIALEDYDPKLLAKAKIKQEIFRERDLKGHMINTDPDEMAQIEASAENADREKGPRKDFSQDELESSVKGKKAGDKEKLADEDLPARFNPKEDYQVREALNYLKSYELLKKLVVRDASGQTGTETATAR